MSLFRNTVWYLKGLREYTREGYNTAAKSFQAGELEVDCSGLSYLVTGANSGLGKQTARELASRGGTVHLVCRNPDTGEEAREEISGLTIGDSKVHLHILDISQPEKVAEFVAEFQSSQEKLDVLVNNAGCMVAARELTKEGLDRNWATNVLGTYLLTTGLLPLLQRADKPRVVTVSSGGMLVQKLTAEDPQSEQMEPYDGTMAYAQNKRQQVVLTEHWAAQHPAVHFSVMHPGWADTPAVRTAMPDFHKRFVSIRQRRCFS